MIHDGEIAMALAAHGFWRERLELAISAGKCDLTPEEAAADTRCEFGKWMAHVPAGEQKSAHFQEAKAAHARFHQEAAKVLQYAVSGRRALAKRALGTSSRFSKSSAALRKALTEWHRTCLR